ncbi:MAG: 3'-5' exonuclease DinG [Chroococcopsis gigantea SAG 12.99]|jgi:ATP-dependent DNA helicase RecQ|nr:3'-5' exonuclease DinG [Chroococcopsis gigantea SAG 12.99]
MFLSPLERFPDDNSAIELPRGLKDRIDNQYIYIDLEIGVGSDSIHSIGVVSHPWRGAVSPESFERVLEGELSLITEEAFAVCGHNFRRFDAPYLEARYPMFKNRSIIDTLELSVIVHPLRSSHRLDKDYKLSDYASNNPLEDALATRSLLHQLIEDFLRKPPELQRAYRWFLCCGTEESDRAYRELFALLGFDGNDLRPPHISTLPEGAIAKTARSYLRWLWDNGSTQRFDSRLCAAGLLAWNYESHMTGDTVSFPRWLTHLQDFPLILEGLFPLLPDGFTYHPYLECFGLKNFRSHQEEIIRSILAVLQPLVVMPTGGGKSLCYQLPALMLHETQRALTVVLSPLQALMADQVADLEARGLHFSTYINGMLAPTERKHRLQQLYRGEKGLLYISPEQLRAVSIRSLLEERPPALWVIDEAHCISQWGHHFRPDYRYIPKFIEELYRPLNAPIPRIALMTATATVAVREDIKALFAKHELAIGTEINLPAHRPNLHYHVIPCNGDKDTLTIDRVKQVVKEDGCILVYTTTAKNAERLSLLLEGRG